LKYGKFSFGVEVDFQELVVLLGGCLTNEELVGGY